MGLLTKVARFEPSKVVAHGTAGQSGRDCREYDREAIINWLLSYSIFMININFSC